MEKEIIPSIQPPLDASDLLQTRYYQVETPLRLGQYSEAELKMAELLQYLEKPKPSSGIDLAFKSILFGHGIALMLKLAFILLFAYLK